MSDAMERSRVVEGLRARYDAITTAAANSWPARATAALRRVANGSRLVQWLRRDPEPRVIVVDLTETRTVGPLIAALDAIAAQIGKGWRGSPLQASSQRLRASVADAPIRTVGALAVGFVLAAVLADAATGALTPTALGTAGVFGGLGLLATRVDASAADLRRSYTWGALAALFAPPEPPAASRSDRPAGESREAGAAGTDDDGPKED
jgi:hypothetical protein